MSNPFIIKKARIIDPGRNVDETGDITIDRNGRLVHGTDIENSEEYTVINAEGLIVCPGFIDLHCHLRQPGYEDKETIESGTKAAARGGFTTVCCMPNTIPALDSVTMIKTVTDIADKDGLIRVLPIACVSEERKGLRPAPLSELSEMGIAGFSDDGSPVFDPELMVEALQICKDTGLPVIEHCEVPELAGDGVINEGAVSSQLGIKGIPAAAEENMVARDIELAGQTGGWVHIAHASTAGSVDLIRKGKARGIHVTAEVTPHHLTLTEDEVIRCGNEAKVNPPLRTQEDIDALIEGLNDGTIDIIATDHAPHTKADKTGDIYKAAFGFSGFETALGSLMTLVHSNKITLPLLIKKLTARPAEILGNRPGIAGELLEDQPADLVIFDPNREWSADPDEFLSKGKNTPLAGTRLKGKVIATFYKGKLVYKDDSFLVEYPR